MKRLRSHPKILVTDKRVIDLIKAIKITVLQLIFTFAIFSQTATAQQMIVDDATITPYRSTQLEFWYGTEESSFQLNIGSTRWLNISPAVNFKSVEGFEANSWLIELKAVPGDLGEDEWAYGLILAPVFNFDGNLEEFYTYVSYSKTILSRSSVIHINFGVEGANIGGWELVSTSGVRGDFSLSNHVTMLFEVFTSNFETPSFQGGVRLSFIPDFMEMDITYGHGFHRGMSYPGLNIGMAITLN